MANKTMAIKYAKAKKEAVKQMIEDSDLASCATKCVRQSESALWNLQYKPYSRCKK